jgi:hypothetical protein
MQKLGRFFPLFEEKKSHEQSSEGFMQGYNLY